MLLNINYKPKKIYIPESRIFILGEGIENEGVFFSPPTETNPYIDTTITPIKRSNYAEDPKKRKNYSDSDYANRVADTRFMDTRNHILYGDRTNARADSLDDAIKSKSTLINAYTAAVEAIKSGRRRNPNLPKCSQNTYNSIMGNLLNPNKSDEDLIDYFENIIYQNRKQYDMSYNKYNRALNTKDPNKLIPKYDVGLVPGTDVKVIALFKFNDFNFSDAIKNGELRQTKDTDKKLGIKDYRKEREKNEKPFGRGTGTNKKLKTTYDNGTYTPDIATNFSLNGIDVDAKDPSGLLHFKQQFKSRDAYNTDDEYNADTKSGYSTITQFMDKSILAANYALKNEGVKVDYILPAPSSSKFNKYYCFNLSQKIGAECKFDFFKRNLLNVKLDDGIYNAGLTEKIIEDTKRLIKDAAVNEISSYLMDTVKEFVSENFNLLSTISVKKSSREKVSFGLICELLKHYSYYGLCNIYEAQPKVSNIHKYLVNHFMDYTEIEEIDGIDSEHVLNYIIAVIKAHLSTRYQEMLRKLDSQIWKYQDYLKEENGGWKLSYNKKFKITDIDKKARPFIRDAYVVADEELDSDRHLFERYKNAHFLIVDEDMNSGGTLMLLIRALKDQFIGHVGKRGRYATVKSNQITCLVNGYTLV